VGDLSLVSNLTRGADTRDDDRFLEDFINLLDYRPSANRGKKQDDEDLPANREQYLNLGLDERSATAVQAISRSDRVDYMVKFYSNVLTSLLTCIGS
jgi:hypothetical protein